MSLPLLFWRNSREWSRQSPAQMWLYSQFFLLSLGFLVFKMGIITDGYHLLKMTMYQLPFI